MWSGVGNMCTGSLARCCVATSPAHAVVGKHYHAMASHDHKRYSGLCRSTDDFSCSTEMHGSTGILFWSITVMPRLTGLSVASEAMASALAADSNGSQYHN